jgi:hypothetical protein
MTQKKHQAKYTPEIKEKVKKISQLLTELFKKEDQFFKNLKK